jgi:hypothetical protein
MPLEPVSFSATRYIYILLAPYSSISFPVHTHTHTHTPMQFVCMHVHQHACIYDICIDMHVCLWIYALDMCVPMDGCMHWIYVCLWMYALICVCLWMDVCIGQCVCMYIWTNVLFLDMVSVQSSFSPVTRCNHSLPIAERNRMSCWNATIFCQCNAN